MTNIDDDSALAAPTKQFFVSMLTRDISLTDAILDLVDNCLDGALRLSGDGDVDYVKYRVEIDLTAESFTIRDNCGGIPRDVAENYAFKMGRDLDDDRYSDSETIGMYGIGMKRAIFKMGRDALVSTNHNGDSFNVPISSEWLDSKDWSNLPMLDFREEDMDGIRGTVIRVSSLFPSVVKQFGNEFFVNDLKTAIGEHFTSFLQKGLSVCVNGAPVKPVFVDVLVSEGENSPAPYMYKKTIDGVQVSIIVGLNTSRGSDDEEDDFERARSATTAGWTVFCNDRAVIVGDKSRLTGWGDDVPMYHGQFSIITGIIEFRSASANKLPITTTKRALDTSSDVWLEARSKMREGLKVFISYTNKWKNNPRSDQSVHWAAAKPLPLKEAVEVISKRHVTKKPDKSIEYNPMKKKVLPEPKPEKPSSRRIVFSRPLEEIQEVSEVLFDKADEKPGSVGDRCFELVLEKIQNGKKA